jgi:hypothetical protein
LNVRWRGGGAVLGAELRMRANIRNRRATNSPRSQRD